MGQRSMSYYADQLAIGLEYEKFVKDILIKEIGIELNPYMGMKQQLLFGENRQGMEIKFNSKMTEYKSIYFEVEERSRVDRPYNDSGILRKDNSWLYICGNYSLIYIFGKKHLQKIKDSGLFVIKEIARKTSKGFTMSLLDADKYCLKKIEVQNV